MLYGIVFKARRYRDGDAYWNKGNTKQGVWVGQACQEYGVEAGMPVREEQFEALRQNQHAVTGEQVTERQNTTRIETFVNERTGKLEKKRVSNRREFYDFSLCAPPTYSVLGITGRDDRVMQWHARAVEKVIAEMERHTGRRNTGEGDRIELTGKFCTARYRHDFNKCMEPLLHDHLVIFNMTPGKDGLNYAVEARVWMDRSNYLTAVYRDVMASEAIKAGFEVGVDRYGAPVIKGLEDLAETLSRRSKEIEALVERIEEHAGIKLALKEVKKIVFASRGLDMKKFEALWETNRESVDACKDLHSKDAENDVLRRRLLKAFRAMVWEASDRHRADLDSQWAIRHHWSLFSEEQAQRLTAYRERSVAHAAHGEPRSLYECLTHGIEHCFERSSVVKDYEVITEALKHAMGQDVDLLELRKAAAGRAELIRGKGCEVTTERHLTKELELVCWVTEGKGKGISVSDKVLGGKLNAAQKEAISSLLRTGDRFSAFIGKAGTGKTTSLTELVSANLASGHFSFLMAPSNAARDVMRAEADDLPDHRKRDGTAEAFRSAQSLQMFLSSPSLQAAVEPGDLVILDEAGAASVEDVHRLMAFAKLRECRVLFSGDPRQHASVEAGDALRVLLKRSEIHRSALFEIVRQNPDAMEGKYLKAAKLFSQGKTTSAFAKLDEVNAIFEHKGKAREEAIAEAIVQEMREGKSVVAVNPSHRENGAVCDAVRQRLKAKGMLQDERTIHAYRSLGWTYAEKRATNKICVGQVIEITRGPSKGKAFDVVAVDKGKVTARNGEGEERVFDRRNARMIDVCERFDLNVAVGDRLITRAGVRCGNGEVINGEKVTVTGFDEAGNVMGAKGKLITTKNLAHAYAMTSHRSQGDTADTVIFGLDRKSVRWADQKLAYVAGTRGRTRIQIFVENKADLTGLQTRPGDRKAASEMEIRQPEKLSHEVRHLMEQAEHHRRVLEERQKHRGYEMAVE